MQISAPPVPCPTETNGYLRDHARLLRESYKAITGRDLIDCALADADATRAVFEAPFALLSHHSGPDPILTYANRRALDLFELTWERLVVMPSRLTAEASERAERERLLQAVRDRGFVDGYAGVRVSASGRRFMIEGGIVWNLADGSGRIRGQAATFAQWRYL
jgi:hypothetical protein